MAHKKRLLQCDRITYRKPYQSEDRETERERERNKFYTNYSRLRHQNNTHSGKKLLSIKAQFFFLVVGSFYVVCYVRCFSVAVDRNRSQSANNITALTLALNDDGCCRFFLLFHFFAESNPGNTNTKHE